jgi:uncharacterized protein
LLLLVPDLNDLMGWIDGFDGRCVVVTGASSGIGRATALAFAAAGARVAVLARRSSLLDSVAEEARHAGGYMTPVVVDVTDRHAVRTGLAAAADALGGLDIVVNNAGILRAGPVLDIEPADLDAMMRVNVYGALFVMQEAARLLVATGGGSIVNVASLAGRRGLSPLGGYCATKFALVGLTEALREELRGSAVHLALIEPGLVETPMVDGLSHDEEFLDFWPRWLEMPPSWVVWAIFAAVRFQLLELSVPPGAATVEKLASLSPGVADMIVQWAKRAGHWLATAREN